MGKNPRLPLQNRGEPRKSPTRPVCQRQARAHSPPEFPWPAPAAFCEAGGPLAKFDVTEPRLLIQRALMRQGSTSNPVGASIGGEPEPGQDPEASRRPPGRGTGTPSRRRWLSEPKAVIWLALAAAILLGGGRRLIAWWQARKAVARLDDPDVTTAEIEAVADYGRTGVYDLLRIFSSAPTEPARQAAGRSLARLWLLDQLVAEEEQAVVRRGFTVTWSARRRYPRSLKTEIPITVAYQVPFLDDSGRRIDPKNLEWSHRLLGARRMTLEEFSPWTPGAGRVAFTIFPGDFETNGPHRLVLQARVRTLGLTDSWEIEPPHVPFLFEFDPILKLDAILTLPDATRDEQFARAICLEPATVAAGENSTYVSLGAQWALRDPPRLAVTLPIPCDLAHEISVEIQGITRRFAGGSLVVSGQGLVRAKVRLRRNQSSASSIWDRFSNWPRMRSSGQVRGRCGSGWKRPRTAAGPTRMSVRSGPVSFKPTGSTSKSSDASGNSRRDMGSRGGERWPE